MPRNENGIYSLPDGYEAVTGETIQPSQHNPPLEDIASALTGSLPRNGAAPMTGAIRLVDGTVATPAAAFNSAAGTGWYKLADGIGFSVAGVQVAAITSSGIIGLPIGTPIPVLDDTLPALCIWADGRNVNRVAYSALFAKWGTKYGAGDGTTTFGMPDLRSVPLVGRDNIGGTDAGRLTSVPVVSGNRLTTGGIIGEVLHALTQAELPAIAPTGSVSGSINNITAINAIGNQNVELGSQNVNVAAGPVTSSIPISFSSPLTFTGNVLGSGSSHNTVQRSFLCNFVIYAGA